MVVSNHILVLTVSNRLWVHLQKKTQKYMVTTLLMCLVSLQQLLLKVLPNCLEPLQLHLDAVE